MVPEQKMTVIVDNDGTPSIVGEAHLKGYGFV